jgi:methyl halide transferase
MSKMSSSREPEPDDKPSEARERLRQHFQESSLEQHPDKWHDLYVQEWLPWDRSAPNPALIDTITQRVELLGPATSTDSSGNVIRKKALVPGCGKGYDVLLLASYGYNAVGLDVSDLAIKLCEEYREQNEGKGEYATKDAGVGSGTISFAVGDFFKDTWTEPYGGKFDLIYDYTVSLYTTSIVQILICVVSVRAATAHKACLGPTTIGATFARRQLNLRGVPKLQTSINWRASLGSAS